LSALCLNAWIVSASGSLVSRITKVLFRTMPPWMRKRIGVPLDARHDHGEGWAERHQSSLAEDAFLAKVTQITHETPRAVTIEFELLEGYRFSYRAGQYVAISLPIGGVSFQRCFSLSSAPDENRYAITVQKVFHGRVSTYLNESLRVGDQLYVSDPAGDFVLPAEALEEQRYLMVAGGSGIVPIYSLIKDLLGKNPEIEIQLVYFSRSAEQCIFRKELERLGKQHPGLLVQFHFTRREGNYHDPARRLTSEGMLALVSDPAASLFYVCGPNSLVKACMEGLHSAGVEESRIRIELFNRPPVTLSQTELKPRLITFLPGSVFGKVRHVRQRKVETILESARSAGIVIPQKCSVGNCATCKVRLKSGSVIMDEPNSLSVEAAKDGYVLSCVAYPCENVVVQLPGR
jgi:ferredoxin-NADP reductase